MADPIGLARQWRVSLCCLVVALASCGPPDDLYTLFGLVRLGPESIIVGNDVELIVQLNDTVFKLEELRLYGSEDVRSVDSTATKSPSLRLCLRNVGVEPLLAPVRSRVLPCDTSDCRQGFGVSFGTVDGHITEFPVVGRVGMPSVMDSNYFALIQPGGTACRTDVTNLFGLRLVRAIEPGTFWVHVRFLNYWWLDTVPAVWIGDISSDTLWFRVTE